MRDDRQQRTWIRSLPRPSPTTALTALLAVQAVCIVLFLIDVTADLMGRDDLLERFGHHYIELAVVATLIVSTYVTFVTIHRLRAREKRMEEQLRVASGALMELIDEYFDAWGLTPSERDVALLSIKGLSIGEIAALRNTKEGTVKAQSNAIYSKAGVTGRPQLLSLFIEDLMNERLVPESTAA